jgi:ribonuclease Z
MLAAAGRSVVLVDCGGDVVQRLLAAGLEVDRIAMLVITHEHADHVSGFPLFMEKIWLAQRRRPIPVCGPRAAIDQARTIFEAFDTSGWKRLPAIDWREVALEEGAAVWNSDEWRVTAAPGIHSVPVIGVRVEHLPSGTTFAYSSDTERSDAISRLSQGADLLVHEATGDHRGHITAAGAGAVAREAGAKRLVMIHIPPGFSGEDLTSARSEFPSAELGHDGARYSF